MLLMEHICGTRKGLRHTLHPHNSVTHLPTQVLPVSDTSVRGTWRDSYPYSSLCVFALHPLYLRLQALSGDSVPTAPWKPSGWTCSCRLMSSDICGLA